MSLFDESGCSYGNLLDKGSVTYTSCYPAAVWFIAGGVSGAIMTFLFFWKCFG